MDNLLKELDLRKQKMIDIYRYLHQHPELSFQESETARYIADFYRKLGINVREGVSGNGVIAILDSGKPGKSIAIRADFDALPIQEETGLEWASLAPGVMHACGHDAHTACLLVLAESLLSIKDELTGKITFIHQPAEEKLPGGAIEMINAGVLEGIDEIYGLHLSSFDPTGTVLYREGETMAGNMKFEITIHGRGGHAAHPEDTVDAILVASQFVVSAQSIVSRMINPERSAVVSIGDFRGEGASNIIQDQVTLSGGARFFDEESHRVIRDRLEQILRGVCDTYGATYEINYIEGYPVLVNDPDATRRAKDALINAQIAEVKEAGMGTSSEDFAYYLQRIPGSYFFVGCAQEGQPITPHHSPKFQIDERALLIAAKSMGAVVLDALES